MRIPILLFLTLLSLFISCNDSTKDIRKFDLDSQSFLFFNEGSYWVYLDKDNVVDTITLVEVDQGYKKDRNGDDYVDYRIDKYWSSANQHFFTRASRDTTVFLFDSQYKKYEFRDVFAYKNKYHTYFSDIEDRERFLNFDFYLERTYPNMIVNGFTGFGKEIFIGASFYVEPDSILNKNNILVPDTIFDYLGQYVGIDSTVYAFNQSAEIAYIENIGMVRYTDVDNDTEIKLIGYYLAPEK